MQRVRPRNSAVDAIASWVFSGRYRPGDALPIEPAIGQELSVSRTVVREALKTLGAKGVVVTGPRRGTRVRPSADWNLFDPDVVRWRLRAGVDPAFVRDLVELRDVIEPAAARLAAKAATRADVAVAAEAFDAMARAVDGDGSYLDADLRFHRALLAATHNPFIAGMTVAFSALLSVSFRISVRSMEGARASLPDHRRVLDAIAARNPESAEAAMRALIRAAGADLEDALAAGNDALATVAA